MKQDSSEYEESVSLLLWLIFFYMFKNYVNWYIRDVYGHVIIILIITVEKKL